VVTAPETVLSSTILLLASQGWDDLEMEMRRTALQIIAELCEVQSAAEIIIEVLLHVVCLFAMLHLSVC